ncbi:MAG: hypothetical protein CVV41_03485 [Candidatus Riflebacteria bacterium HGW-Riflebacteria-1]|jgi:hypothetical protein|nr:MAG: hypothetical protein CVV41_03485 [Candidatus Riflebacteria bacterium HGW-Riflebacteria-1]
MKQSAGKFNLYAALELFPALGIAVYFVLFYVAAALYPGGSQADLRSTGYSWIDNYWCELMNHEAMNGQPHPGAVYAIIAMIFAGSAIGVFFYRLPLYCRTTAMKARIIRTSAALTGLSGVMLFGDFHNPALLCFSLATLVTLVVALLILLENGRKAFFAAGLLSMSLTQINNIMYYLRLCVQHIPWFQKIAIAAVLLWVAAMNVRLRRIKDPTSDD